MIGRPVDAATATSTAAGSQFHSLLTWWLWEPFWPAVASVALGIPVALWLYNVTTRHATRTTQVADNTRRGEIIAVLTDVLGEHVNILEQNARRPHERFETLSELRTAVWESVRLDAFRLLPAPELRARLASHFERVERLNRAHETRTNRILDRIGRPHYSSPQPTEDSVHETLRREAASAAGEARTLVQLLTDVQPLS